MRFTAVAVRVTHGSFTLRTFGFRTPAGWIACWLRFYRLPPAVVHMHLTFTPFIWLFTRVLRAPHCLTHAARDMLLAVRAAFAYCAVCTHTRTRVTGFFHRTRTTRYPCGLRLPCVYARILPTHAPLQLPTCHVHGYCVLPGYAHAAVRAPAVYTFKFPHVAVPFVLLLLFAHMPHAVVPVHAPPDCYTAAPLPAVRSALVTRCRPLPRRLRLLRLPRCPRGCYPTRFRTPHLW